MQIITTRTGDTKIKITRTEQQTLRKAAKLVRSIAKNVEDEGSEMDYQAANALESIADSFGPVELEESEA